MFLHARVTDTASSNQTADMNGDEKYRDSICGETRNSHDIRVSELSVLEPLLFTLYLIFNFAKMIYSDNPSITAPIILPANSKYNQLEVVTNERLHNRWRVKLRGIKKQLNVGLIYLRRLAQI